MPRRKTIRLPPRLYAEPGRVFSLTVCTAEKRPWFHAQELAGQAVNLLAETGARHGIDVHAYCLMPDHCHLLVGAGDRSSLLDLIRDWKSLVDRAWRSMGNTGKLWQRSFYDHALRQEESIEVAARYILANPVRAGLVGRGQHDATGAQDPPLRR